MKLTKLLVLGALCLFGTSAWAADLIERTKPQEPSWVIDITTIDRTPCTFQPGDVYVIYNVGADMFYYHGNAWGSQASGSATNAIPVRFLVPSGKSLADKQLYLRDYDDRSNENKWRTAFIAKDGHVAGVYGDGTPAIFIDNNDGTAALMWVEVFDVAAKTYRISVSEDNTTTKPEGLFWGIDPEGPGVDNGEVGTCIMPKLAAGTNTEWQFFAAPAEMATYYTALDIYNTSTELKAVIERAEAINVDASAAVTVYNDEASTDEQMKAAMADLKNAMTASFRDATAENPGDATSMIDNPNFDNKSTQGWSGNAPGFGGDDNQRKAWVAEHYNATFDTYQNLSALPAGVYALKANTFFRGTWEDYAEGKNQDCYPLLYATTADKSYSTMFNNAWAVKNIKSMATSTTEWGAAANEVSGAHNGQTYYIPNDPSAFRLYQEQGYYPSAVVFEVTDGNVQIGVKKDKKEGGTDWAVFDTFGLTYYGNTVASYQKAFEDAFKAKYNTPLVGSYTAQYKNDFDAAVAAAIAAKTVTTVAESDAALAEAQPAIINAQDTLIANMGLWKQWEAKLADAEKAIVDYEDVEDDCFMDLLEYASPGEPDVRAAIIKSTYSLTNDEIRAEIETLSGLIAAVEDAAKKMIQPGDPVTDYIVNPKFDDPKGAEYGWTGWHTVGSMPTTGGTADNKTAEAWNSASFDLYQEVPGLPVGVYEISVQGFYRYWRNDAGNNKDAWGEYTKQESEFVKPNGAPVFVYVNDIKTPFKNVYDEEGQDQEFYVTMANKNEDGTPKANDSGEYEFPSGTQSLDIIPNIEPRLCYPNGMASAAVAFSAGLYKQSASSLVAKKGDKLRIGVKGVTNQLGDSWVIWDNFELKYKGFDLDVVKPVLEEAIAKAEPKMDETFASDLKEQLQTALADAQAALTETNGKAMFDKLAALAAVDVDGSIQKFKDFEAAVFTFESTVANAADAPDDSRPIATTIESAATVLQKVQNYVDTKVFTDAQLDEALAEMEEMTKLLAIPAAMNTASDNAPANATYLITNPSYDEGNADGWTRENATGNYGVEYTVCENFNGKFDVYQDLTNMLEGTYEMSVQTFYRNGSSVNDYKAFLEDDPASYNASVYVTVGENKLQASAPLLASVATSYTSVDLNEKEEFIPETNYAWAVEQDALQKTEDGSSATGMQVPNNRNAINSFFENEIANETSALKVSIIFKVGAEGKARIGIAKTAEVGNDWTAWDNWTLTYFGPNSAKEPGVVNGIKDASEVADVVKTEVYSLSGAQVKSGKGIAIVRQTLSNGTVRVKKVIVK